MNWLFRRMEYRIEVKLKRHQSGLSTALLFPIAFSSTLTFLISRLISYYWPRIYFEPTPGLHIHHFTYGVFIMAAAGYLALVFSGPRAKFWIAMLLGLGLGLAFDEFGMWLRLTDDNPARFEYDGIVIVFVSIIMLFTLPTGLAFIRRHVGRNREVD